MFRFALEQIGAEVNLIVLRDGKEAMDYLSGQTHSEEFNRRTFVVLDLNVPKANGFEVLAWTRSQPNLRRLVIIVLTASSSAADADRAFELGANFYLTKPGPFKELVEMTKCLQDWLRLNHFPTL